MTKFFSELFTSDDLIDVEECCAKLQRKIPHAMIEFLLAPFTSDDVLKALQEMSHSKTPGPDGFSASFYQMYWDIVGADPDLLCITDSE